MSPPRDKLVIRTIEWIHQKRYGYFDKMERSSKDANRRFLNFLLRSQNVK